jgi:DNA polymerase III delta prime subunit
MIKFNTPENLLPSHQLVLNKLKSAIQKGRTPRALIIEGVRGVGKGRLTVEIARILGCESEELKPCGSCFHCKSFTINGSNAGENPWMWLLPQKGVNQNLEAAKENALKLSQNLVRDPWNSKLFENNASHPISAVRSIQEQFQFRATGNRIVIIPEADRMTPATANSILKVLEEAPDSTYFVLTTAFRHQLLQTIRSRCVSLTIPPLDFPTYQKELNQSKWAKDETLSEEYALLLWSLTEGAWGRTEQFIDSDLLEMRSEVLGFLKTFHKSIPDLLDKNGPGQVLKTGWGHKLSLFLYILYLLLADMQRLGSGLKPRNRDLQDDLLSLKLNNKPDAVDNALEEVNQAILRAKQHVGAQMNFTALILGLRKSIL